MGAIFGYKNEVSGIEIIINEYAFDGSVFYLLSADTLHFFLFQGEEHGKITSGQHAKRPFLFQERACFSSLQVRYESLVIARQLSHDQLRIALAHYQSMDV